MYKAIALKYRPQNFSEVIGQDHVVTTLKNALITKKVSHAYIFCGSRGTGKTTLARVLAKALNCENPKDHMPCLKCPSCLEIANSCSLDVLEIDGASNRGIDDIRSINETVIYASSQGKYKIYIIDEVHMLTKEAFNALLKTLEEPPSHVKFFFATTEPNKVPATVASRCQRFDLKRIGIEDIVKNLKWIVDDLGLEANEEALTLIADLAEGSLRDAESILDQIICYLENTIITEEAVQKIRGLSPKKLLKDLDEAINLENVNYAFLCAEQVFSSGVELYSFVEDLLQHFKTTLLKVLNQEKTSYTKEHILSLMELLTSWLQSNPRTYFKKIHLENILLQLITSKSKPSIQSIAKELLELKSYISSTQPQNVTSQKAFAKASNNDIPLSEKSLENRNPPGLFEKLPQNDTTPPKVNIPLVIQDLDFGKAGDSDLSQAKPASKQLNLNKLGDADGFSKTRTLAKPNPNLESRAAYSYTSN